VLLLQGGGFDFSAHGHEAASCPENNEQQW